jgi:hypothetical protein
MCRPGADLPLRRARAEASASSRMLTPFAKARAFLRDVGLAYANVAGADSGQRQKAFDLLPRPSSRPGDPAEASVLKLLEYDPDQETARQLLTEIRAARR